MMMISFLTSGVASGSQLLMVGGGPRPTEAMNQFVQAAGGPKANIIVCPWASESTESSFEIKTEFLRAKAKSVTVMPMNPKGAKEDETLLKQIKAATGIFFAGGDQNVLMQFLKSKKLEPFLKTAFQQGVVFGGTSAGTAIMSTPMITGDVTPTSEGLGLLPNGTIVDQHFIVRDRFSRLESLLRKNKAIQGIGIDEGTALWVKDNKTAEVIGPSKVVLFLKEATGEISRTLFANHEKFELEQVLAPATP